MQHSFYGNPHPRVQPQVHQQQTMQQPVQVQLPPNVQIVMTTMGPQYQDMTNGNFLSGQQVQMMMQMAARQFQPQQMMQYQRQMQPQQPQHQFQPQARLTGGQMMSQFDPHGDLQDNRFDGPENPQQPQFQQPHQEQSMRIPSNPSNTVTIIEQKSFVPGKKLLKSKNASFLVRTRPFMENEVQSLNMNVASGGFSMAVEQLYEEAYLETDKNKLVVVGKCMLTEGFYDTSLRGLVSEIYQPDVEQVYRFMKQAVDNLTTRGDIVFMSEYNQWLTDQVNDILKVLMPEPANIDSFVEDFNDLKKFLGDVNTVKPELQSIYQELCNRIRRLMLAAADIHTKVKDADENRINSDAVYIVENANIVFCKLMSTELWKDGIPDTEDDGNRLISSLADHISEEVFYILTLDKVVYKVIVALNGVVNVTLVGS